ncbi:MAG: AAA family ATPase [Thermosphaera sp.]
MGITFNITTCGPIKSAKLTLPDWGIVAIIGPSLSGKSMLEAAISSYALASTVVSDGVLLGTLADRLIRESWGKLFSSLDRMEYLSSVQEYKGSEDFFRQLEEVIENATDRVLNIKGYLARMAFLHDFCAAKEIEPWGKRVSATLEVDISVDQSRIYVRLPVPDPKLVGPKVLSDHIELNPALNVVGLNIGRPTRFLKELYENLKDETHKTVENETRSRCYPSALLAHSLLNDYRARLDPDVYQKFKEILKESWEEISSLSIKNEEIAFLETKRGPAVKFGDKIFSWDWTSEGFKNMLAHLLLFELVELLALEGKRIIIGIEEPEAHLDPYVAFRLPALYSLIGERRKVVFLFTTHSEALVKGIEYAVRVGNLKCENVKVYETIGKEKTFTLEERPVRESGIIEGSRFTKIAWKILRGEWNEELGKS